MSDEVLTTELYKVHRPSKLSELLGQDDAVKTIKGFGKDGVPHCLLLVGPSGCGKTTIARILKRLLLCSDYDFHELNCAADARGIDTIRSIQSRMWDSSMGGGCRIWLLDEAGKLTGDAQTALLKMLEDTPPHVYFFLATTDPQKLISTIKTRATEIKVKALKGKDMESLLSRVAAAEKFNLTEEVRDKLVDVSEGSARKALVLLNQIIKIESEEDQLAAVSSGVANSAAIEIARALINPKATWGAVSKLLKDVEDEPETVRRVVLGYCKSVLLGGGNLAPRARDIIFTFEKAWYDGGAASMVACCYDVVVGK